MYPTTIPFSGFYNSFHDQLLDEQLEQVFSDRATGFHVNYDLVARASNKIDWRRVHTEYAKEYCVNFAYHLGIRLEFDELSSPREYNFTTDLIFVKMDEATLMEVRRRVDDKVLRDAIHERHTSYDGFHSFYPNTIEEWPDDVLEWDHNQVGTLMIALLLTEFPDWDQYQEYDLMSDDMGNGVIDNILFGGEDGEYLNRLARVHEYLDVTRPARTTTA